MPRRRRPADAEPVGGTDPDHEAGYLAAWGLEPAQWRPVGSLAHVRERAALLWRTRGEVADLSLRVRRAYDRLGELGVTVAADSTARGLEIALPLARVPLALRILADRSILPDAVLVEAPPAERLRMLRREIGAHRREIELVLGDGGGADPIAELRARARTSS
jgi:hypothetical protein